MFRVQKRKLKIILANIGGRVRLAMIPIIQCSIAAGLAWYIATRFNTLHNPFFAPIAAIICLGINLEQRQKRSIQVIFGVCIGIVFGSLLVDYLGNGWWQLIVIVSITMLMAVILNSSMLTAMQSGTTAIIVSTLVISGQGTPVDRLIDTIIGALVGTIVAIIIPTHPLLRSREKAAKLLILTRTIVGNVGIGLTNQDQEFLQSTLDQARTTQALVNKMLDEIKAGKEISKYSPYFYKYKKRLTKHADTTQSIDNAVRNTRVLARTALVAVSEHTCIDPNLPNLVQDLLPGFAIVVKYVQADPDQYPDAVETVRVLRKVTNKVSQHTPQHGGLYTAVMYSQLRSILTDLFQIAGLSLIEAEELVPHKFIMDES